MAVYKISIKWNGLQSSPKLVVSSLQITHSYPMHPFSTPWKHQKTLRFSDNFRSQRKSALGMNGLTSQNVIKNQLNENSQRWKVSLPAEAYVSSCRTSMMKNILDMVSNTPAFGLVACSAIKNTSQASQKRNFKLHAWKFLRFKKNWDRKKVLQLDKKVNTIQSMGIKFSEGTWEAYSEPSGRSKMKLFAEIVNSSKLLNIFSKSPILDILLSYEYASEFFKKTMYRSSFPDVFLGKGVLKICFKFTGKQPCRSVILI